MADHYAVLGLAPYAEHSAVRAAYLELMRRYHPDMNSSEEAAARAREVTAAYEVLGNPDSRTDYDLARAHAHAALTGRRTPAWRSPQALAGIASVGGVALLSLLYLMPRAPDDRVEQMATVSSPSAPRQRAAPAAVRPAPKPVEPDKAVDAMPAPAPVEVVRSPVPVKVASAPPPVEIKRSPAPVQVKRVSQPAISAPPPPRIEPARAVARADKGAELAGLDRHLGMLLRQSVRRADATKQQSLYRDHYRFIARLNNCATEACKKREYLARMGEVTSTMAAPAKPR